MSVIFNNLVNENTAFIFSFHSSLGHTTQYNLLDFQIDNLVKFSDGHLVFICIVYSLTRI